MTHAHMVAYPSNIELLNLFGVKPVVMVRNVADMLRSFDDMVETEGRDGDGNYNPSLLCGVYSDDSLLRMSPTERRSPVSAARRERGIWQRRFWEHAIRDDADYTRHMDYVHYNPVKHGYVSAVSRCPYSTFHRWVNAGIYAADWAGDGTEELAAGEP